MANISLGGRLLSSVSFTEKNQVDITHSLGVFPHQIRVLTEDSGTGGYGLSGFGVGGFGVGGTGSTTAFGEAADFTVQHVDANSFSVFFNRSRTGVVTFTVT